MAVHNFYVQAGNKKNILIEEARSKLYEKCLNHG